MPLPRPRLIAAATALALPLMLGAVVLTPLAAADENQEAAAAVATGNVMAVLEADEQFSTLVGLLETAGLAETLRGEGPFTLLAPNNAAFEKVNPETLETIVASEKRLKRILSFHVVPGRLTVADMESADEVKNLIDKKLRIKTRNDVLTINKRKVLTADVEAENGLIHVMEDSLFPRPKTEGGDEASDKGKKKDKKKGDKKGDKKGEKKGKKKGDKKGDEAHLEDPA